MCVIGSIPKRAAFLPRFISLAKYVVYRIFCHRCHKTGHESDSSLKCLEIIIRLSSDTLCLSLCRSWEKESYLGFW